MDYLMNTWHWSVSGFLIGLIMLGLIYFGKGFGMSSNLRSLCSMTGIGKKVSFFDWDWKSQTWNLVVVFGAILGGFFASQFLMTSENVAINPVTIEKLQLLGINAPNGNLLPTNLFGLESLQSFNRVSFLLIGGILIGFGSRYAGGCTSGHAISGLVTFKFHP
jgi:uncharacterized membrane protein YedE/YeeE